jgi:hypothetical protein
MKTFKEHLLKAKQYIENSQRIAERIKMIPVPKILR